jgi:thioredoxin 1
LEGKLAVAFDTPLISNDLSIDRVLAAGLPVLLIFLDGPVLPAFEQTLERLARETSGQALVVKIQVRDSPATTQRYQVERLPAVVAVSGGSVLSKIEQANLRQVEEQMNYLLGKGPRPAAPQPAPAPSSQAAGADPAGHPLPINDGSFDQLVMHATQPVVVDFWAPWCGPCRMVEPTVEKLAHEYAGKVRFYKMNVDENPMISAQFAIQSIPTMMVIKNGQIIDRWAGALPEPALRSRVEPQLRG